jgi:hypothetical protein
MDEPIHISVILARMGYGNVPADDARHCGGTSRHRGADANLSEAPEGEWLADGFSSVGSRRNPVESSDASTDTVGRAG